MNLNIFKVMKIKSFIQLILIIGISSICKNGFTQIIKGGTPPSFIFILFSPLHQKIIIE